MSDVQDTWRLFLALYPPPQVAERMTEFTTGFSRARVPRVPAAQVHMTLVFLGDQPAPSAEAIAEKVRATAAGRGAVALTPRRLVTLPDRAQPRLVALECDATPNLHALYRSLIGIFPALGDNPHRPMLLPHFTLARFRRGTTNRPVRSPAEMERFEVGEVRLMRSVLSEEGSEHTEVARVGLA